MSTSPDSPETVIRLSRDEALILFELLSRWSDEKESETPPSTCFDSPSECAVLHGLLCDLESELAAPLGRDYGQVLADARRRLAHRWDGETLRK